MPDKDFKNDGVPEITRYEHDRKNVGTKKVDLWGYIPGSDEKVRITAVDNGDGTYSLSTAGVAPVGGATSANQTNRSQKTQITDGTDDLPIGPVTALSGTTSTTGAVLLAVAPGFKVRLFHVSYVPTTSATVDSDVSISIGANVINGWRTNFNGGGYMRSPKGGQGWFAGADGEDVTITLSGVQPVRWNLEYDIVAV